MGSGEPFPEKPKVEKPKVENRSLNNTNNNDKEVNLAASAAEERQRGMTNPNSGNRTDAVVQGDPMDGLLFGARLAADQGNQLASRIQEYPQDCQQTLTWFVEVFGWPVGSIPSRPIRGKQGGSYAQWINELRDINQVISGFGKDAIQAVKAPCEKLSISHPAAVMWALPAEVGKLAQRQQRQKQSATNLPYDGALDNFNPGPRPSRESLGLQPAAWERQA
jgi:hypothetical protein